MGTIPTQGQVDGMLGDIEHYTAQVRELWRWAAPNFYERPRRKGMEINPEAAKPPEDYQMKPRGPGPGSGPEDPVGNLVADTERVRSKGEEAGRAIKDCRLQIARAVACLNDALNRLEDDNPGPEVADIRSIPRSASKTEVLRAQAAQVERGKRARRSGDYGEVTG